MMAGTQIVAKIAWSILVTLTMLEFFIRFSGIIL